MTEINSEISYTESLNILKSSINTKVYDSLVEIVCKVYNKQKN